MELEKQIKYKFPNITNEEIEKIVNSKTYELETTTPNLVTWQEWNWPVSDGDYCKFIGYGSKELYKKLFPKDSIKDIMTNTLYWDLKEFTNIDDIVQQIPNKEIKDFNESNKYSTLFYIFKSLNSDKIITIWDCD